ncbi:hypothetical protein DFP72DRAFT_133166 [Ephemerocybe angulata]|uniref:Uncharacterized protein n=1 Tax=Ephemerocybe angulata TaxID=980116 RepID=A0A8H6I8A1_9AGAR|nr:hypothetical protein DFP72DRAFT_133166 [Tulosesus angulatus]
MASSEVSGGPSILAGAQNLSVNHLGYNEVGGNMYGPTVNIYGAPPLPPLSGGSIYEALRAWLPLIFVPDAQEAPSANPTISATGSNASTANEGGRIQTSESQSREPGPQPDFTGPGGEYTSTPMGMPEPYSSYRPTMPQVYVYHMLRAGKGLACWEPEPFFSPSSEDVKGTVPGDVGSYTPEGGFKKIFNLWDDERSLKVMARTLYQENYTSPPNGLTQRRGAQKGYTVARGAVAEVHESLSGESIEGFEFKCQDQEGAVLVSISEATLEEVYDSAMMHDHICKHAELIYKYADQIRRIGHDTSLYIVTGCIKASDWGLAAFQESMTHPDNVLKLAKRRNGTYLWTHRGTAEAKTGSSEPRDVKDQCLFLQGHKLDFSKAFRARLRSEQPQNRDGASEGGANSGPARDKGNDHQRGEGGRDEMAGGNPNCSNTGGAPPAAGDSFSTRVLDVGVSTTTFPEASRRLTCHPCDVITERLLELTGADFALSHDNDWCPLFEGLSEVDAKGDLQSLKLVAEPYVN